MVPEVGIHCLPIPDGAAERSKESDRLRIAVLFTPQPGSPHRLSVDLEHWPREISERLKDMKLKVFDSSGNELAMLSGDKIRRRSAPGVELADNLWRKIFSIGKDGFQPLYDILAQDSNRTKATRTFEEINEDTQTPAKLKQAVNSIKVDGNDLYLADLHTYPAAALTAFFDEFANVVAEHELTSRLWRMEVAELLAKRAAVKLTPVQLALAQNAVKPFALRLTQRIWDEVMGQLILPEEHTDAHAQLRELLEIRLKKDTAAAARADLVGVKEIEQITRRAVHNEMDKEMDDRAITARNQAFGLVNKDNREITLDSPDRMRDLVAELTRSGLEGGKDLTRSNPWLSLAAPDRPTAFLRLLSRIAAFRDAFRDVSARPKRIIEARYALADNGGKEALDKEQHRDWARRKIMGVRSHPAVAKFLRCIVDVEVEPKGDWWPKEGYLSATVGNDFNHRVAFSLARTKSAGKVSVSWFQPAEAGVSKIRSPVSHKVLPLKGGLVNLKATATYEPRFVLTTTDLIAAIGSTRQRAATRRSELRDGVMPDTLSPKYPEMRGRGIQLLDRQAAQVAMSQLLNVLVRKPALVPYFAEDLVFGYRVDVKRTPRGSDMARSWRSLMARDVEYRDGQSLIPVENTFGEREHGKVRPLQRLTKGKLPNRTNSTPSEYVFSWLGDSLGLPRPPSELLDREDREARSPADRDLGIDITYKFSERYKAGATDEDRLPVLRVGDRYRVGMRPVFLHGGGPTLRDAAKRYDNSNTIGSADDRDFVYGHPNDVGAPLVLVGSDDRLVTAKHVDEVANETHQRIVLRSRSFEDTLSSVRYLVPPRVEFSRVEQFGMFDHAATEETPAGAFESFDLDAESGGFKELKQFKEMKLPGGKEPSILTLKFLGGSRKPKHPYYPDPMARNLGIAFERYDDYAEGFPQDSPARVFWPENPSSKSGPLAPPFGATPIELRFLAWAEGRTGGMFDLDDKEAKLSHGRNEKKIPRIAVDVAPAEDVTVWLWCWPDLDLMFRARPALRKAAAKAIMRSEMLRSLTPSAPGAKKPRDEVAALLRQPRSAEILEDYFEALAEGQVEKFVADRAKLNTIPANAHKINQETARLKILFQQLAEEVQQAFFQPSPFNGATGWSKIKVVHAVPKPLMVPAIPDDAMALRALRIKDGTDWETFLASPEFDRLLKAGGEPGGNKTYFVRELAFDRASTGALRVEVNWPDFQYSKAVRREPVPPDSFRYKDDPPRIDKLAFDIPEIPRDRGLNPAGRINITRSELGRLREVVDKSEESIDLKNAARTAARELNLRIVATSRFTADFKPDSPRKPGDLGKFEVESRPSIGLELSDKKLPVPEFFAEYNIILPATVRAEPPVVTRVEWMGPERRNRIASDHLMMRKVYYPRLYLDASWRGSGEHELLAVILAPFDLVDPQPYDRKKIVQLEVALPQPLGPVAAAYSDEIKRTRTKDGRFPHPFPMHKTGGVTVSPWACFNEPPLQYQECSVISEEVMPFITRWGADAAAAPMGKLEAFISPDRFSGFVASYSRLRLPKPGTSSSGTPSFVDVSALLYKAQLDSETGEWYVEIGIDPGAAHMTKVMLSLARFQPYCYDYECNLDDALSEPISLDAIRVPSQRTVEVFTRGDELTTWIYGVGSMRREPFGIVDSVRHLTDSPLQNIDLVRLTETGPVQVFNRRGDPICKRLITSILRGPMLCWKSDIKLPTPAQGQRYGITIEEVNLHVPDKIIDQYGKARGPGDLIEQPSFFSLAIDLDDDQSNSDQEGK